MSNHFYDVEVFPNFFCATFKDVDTKEIRQFTIFETIDNRKELHDFLELVNTLIGFNNIHYDAPVIRYVLKHITDLRQDLVKGIYNFSAKLISDEGKFDSEVRELTWATSNIKELDLMKIMAFDKLGISLKQTAINLKWYKIQDLPLHYTHIVKKSDVDLILKYNINDVEITAKFYERLRNPKRDIIGLREDLSKMYNLDLMNASDSKMANLLLEDIYSRTTGRPISDFQSLRTKRDEVALKDCIGVNIDFKTNFLRRLKKEIEQTVVRKSQSFAFKKEFEFGGVVYKMGSGGLHSEDKPGTFVENDEYLLFDADINSMYPSIMINNKIKPEHLGNDFVDILNMLTKERLAAKKSGNKVKAESGKIVVNSIYGKLNSDTFWLEDAKSMLSVTISGQLYILMLIERLVLNGIKVISGNTDGLVCLIEKSQKELYDKVCSEWEKDVNMGLEFTQYQYYVRTTVNDYIVKKPSGETKEKGMYVKEIGLNKGYMYPIIPEVFYQYFINKKPVLETLKNAKDVLDFCISQKTGKEFVMKLETEEKTDSLQKNNRFFISTNGGTLYKENKADGRKIGLFVGKKVTLLNDFDETIPFENYQIDYDFYANEAQKYIDDIEKVPVNVIPKDFQDIDSDEFVITFDEKEKSELLLQFQGIKGLQDTLIVNLVKIKKEFTGTSFLDLLFYAENHGFLSQKWENLIEIGYFNAFGGNKKLLLMFNEFRTGKSKFSSKLSEKTRIKRTEELTNIWNGLPNEKLSVMEQIAAEVKVLGRIQSVFPELDKRFLFIINVETKFTPKIIAHCLTTGKQMELKVNKKTFNSNPISPNTIIYADEFQKKNGGKFVFLENGEKQWEEDSSVTVWWLNRYSNRKIQ